MADDISGIEEREEICIRNTYLNLRVPMSEILTAVRNLRQRTGAKALGTAIELTFFAADLPADEMESISLLITLIRCIKDGSVTPPFDIEKLYAAVSMPP